MPSSNACRAAPSGQRPPRYGRTTSGEHVWMKINKQRQGEHTGGELIAPAAD